MLKDRETELRDAYLKGYEDKANYSDKLVVDRYELAERYAVNQAKNNEVLDLVSDCEIDNLLSDLDKDATDYNGYEYGLPICGEWLVTLRTTVRTWLNK